LDSGLTTGAWIAERRWHGLNQDSTEGRRRKDDLRRFDDTRPIENRVGEQARMKNGNCGRTGKLDAEGKSKEKSEEKRGEMDAPELTSWRISGCWGGKWSSDGAVALAGADRDQLSDESKGKRSDG
jgi:hypothetical protein